MKNFHGLLCVTDQVCSMSRDKVNFEDRILNQIRSFGLDNILVRGLTCNDAADAVRCIRDNSFFIEEFRKKCIDGIVYLFIGNTEKSKGGNRFWFSQYLLSIYEEFTELGFEICFVFTCIDERRTNSYSVEKKSSNGSPIEYYEVKNSTTWQQVALKELRLFCADRPIDLMECKVHCTKWDMLSKDSIKSLALKVAHNFIELNTEKHDTIAVK